LTICPIIRKNFGENIISSCFPSTPMVVENKEFPSPGYFFLKGAYKLR
jgi:hypothetical protein